MRLSAILLLLSLFGLLVMTLWGDLLEGGRETRLRAEPYAASDPSARRLFVLVHGFNPDRSRWDEMALLLKAHGEVLRLTYNAGPASNADPREIARRIDEEVAAAVARGGATQVVMVAHSMGALLTRKALLVARTARHPWVARVSRVVLVAGVNRGWDITGPPPDDASTLYRWGMRVGYWGAHMLRQSKLLFEFERGSPFVADLRVDWMQWMRAMARERQRDPQAQRIEVVQLLGDIDDIVRREDNEDLRVMSSEGFALLRVRGTGHGDIIDFGGQGARTQEAVELGAYRCQKLLLAATGDFTAVRLQNEELPAATNPAIREVVFVLHGIRDLGRWSTEFEAEIRRQFPERQEQLAIVSSRYGYLGMGPFLFEGVRDRYVRWFMDQYTETLARYPNLQDEGIRFFGHSNGTYIVAEALKRYGAMHIERVVFAGSVVPKNYDWAGVRDREAARDRLRQVQRPQAMRVRNYVGTEDWVVALFPRLFELPLVTRLGNDLGSAGFNGFDDAKVVNVRYVAGEHSAFESRVGEIVAFLLGNGEPKDAKIEDRGWRGELLSSSLSVLFVWAVLIALVAYMGVRIVSAAPSPAWPVLLLYALLVVATLRTV